MKQLTPEPIEQFIQTASTSPAAYVLASQGLDFFYRGAGRNTRTKNRRPLLVVHTQARGSYEEALKWEKYFKSGAGREWIQRRLPRHG